MIIVDFADKIFALGIVAIHIAIILVTLIFVFLPKLRPYIFNFLGKHAILLAFMVALLSTFASLFYSQIAGFDPCQLCWYQRIFMYPLVIILFVALIKKDYHITDYALSLAFVGSTISLYHNYVYFGGKSLSCSVFARGVSCLQRYVFEFGYVTIPIMALTAFVLIIIFLVLAKLYHKRTVL